MIKLGPNSVKKDSSSSSSNSLSIKIEPIVDVVQHPQRENEYECYFDDDDDDYEDDDDDDSPLQSSSDEESAAVEEQQTITTTTARGSNDNKCEFADALERMENKMDKKIRDLATDMSQKNDQLSNEISSIKSIN